MTKRVLKSILYAVGSGVAGGVIAYMVCPGKFEGAVIPFATLFTFLLSMLVVPPVTLES